MFTARYADFNPHSTQSANEPSKDIFGMTKKIVAFTESVQPVNAHGLLDVINFGPCRKKL